MADPGTDVTGIIDSNCPDGVTEDKCDCLIRLIDGGTFPFPQLDMDDVTVPTMEIDWSAQTGVFNDTAPYLAELSQRSAETMGIDTGIMTEYMICKMTDKLESNDLYKNVSDLSAGRGAISQSVEAVEKKTEYVILMLSCILIYLVLNSIGSINSPQVGVGLGGVGVIGMVIAWFVWHEFQV